MTTAAEPQPASLPLPGGQKDATVRLHPLLTGTSVAPPAYIHQEPGRLELLRVAGIGVSKDDYLKIPIVAYLVEHPGAGPLLIDTGLHPSVAVDPKQSLGRVLGKAFSPRMEPEDAVAAQLRARGIDPREVRLVVMTHLHVDHASGVSEFPEATFVVDRREWDAATEPRGWQNGYRARQFDHAFDWRLVDFDSPDVESYATFGRSFDLLGDGSVRIVATPGHTLGHMSVVVRLADGEVLVAADAIYTRKSLEAGVLPWRAADGHLYKRSLKEIQLFHETRPDALVIPGHDMEFWETLDEVYE